MMSCSCLKDIRLLYTQCKQMMEVTDEELETYRKEREQIEKNIYEEKENADSDIYEIIELQNSIDKSKEKLRK